MTPDHKHPRAVRNALKHIKQTLVKEDELHREPGVRVGDASALLDLGLRVVVGDILCEDHVGDADRHGAGDALLAVDEDSALLGFCFLNEADCLIEDALDILRKLR